MTSEEQIGHYATLLRQMHECSAIPNEKLWDGLRAALQTAKAVQITDEEDILHLCKLILFSLENLASELRREYFLRVLMNLEIDARSRLAMLDCL